LEQLPPTDVPLLAGLPVAAELHDRVVECVQDEVVGVATEAPVAATHCQDPLLESFAAHLGSSSRPEDRRGRPIGLLQTALDHGRTVSRRCGGATGEL